MKHIYGNSNKFLIDGKCQLLILIFTDCLFYSSGDVLVTTHASTNVHHQSED